MREKMKKKKRIVSKLLMLLLVADLLEPMASTPMLVNAATPRMIYEYSGANQKTSGYAQGTITLSNVENKEYSLYWADDQKALDGFEAITTLKAIDGETSFTFGENIAIPAYATQVIAVQKNTTPSVKNAVATYQIPKDKQLTGGGSGKLLYKFNTYSDVHIDSNGYYTNCETNWKNALEYAEIKDVDFVVTAGDSLKNDKGYEKEWETYQKILAKSSYDRPIYEANGNHDMCNEEQGLLDKNQKNYLGNTAFIHASGTNNTIAHMQSEVPYYYMVQEDTGDVFIFMALENGSNPAAFDDFSDEQIEWLERVLNTYYGTGVNIYLIEHATFRGFGPGDIFKTPDSKGYVASYYGAHMLTNGMKNKDGSTVTNRKNNTRFQEILKKYKGIIWMSGHTHFDLTQEGMVNYTNENDTACNMIHIPGTVGTTYLLNDKIQYNSSGSTNDGKGKDSQGYYVEVYDNRTVYYGASMTRQQIFPTCCYIMEGARNEKAPEKIPNRAEISPDEDTVFVSEHIISEQDSLKVALVKAKEMLDAYTKYASYNQYQLVKRLYREHKADSETSDSYLTVLKLATAADQLHFIVTQLGEPSIGNLYQQSNRYYFENTKNWSNVYCYEWNVLTGEKNAEWPGKKLSEKVGSKNGHDIYEFTIPDTDQFTRVIFNDNTHQTVNISLYMYNKDCFYVDKDTVNSHYKVGNYNYKRNELSPEITPGPSRHPETTLEPSTPPETTPTIQVSEAPIIKGNTLYVDFSATTEGNGTQTSPYKTIEAACKSAQPGDTLLVSGTSKGKQLLLEGIHGTTQKPITLKANNASILGGTNGEVKDILCIRNCSDLIVDGFHIKDNKTTKTEAITGIRITGNSYDTQNITIKNCDISNIDCNSKNVANNDLNGHGILVESNSGKRNQIKGIKLLFNKVHDCYLGQSETIVLNGNVTDFEVNGNMVYNNDNIGIDLIGYEENCYEATNRARNGEVIGNIVYGISSSKNKTYSEPCAGGIYVDGGCQNIIKNNVVVNCDIGIEVESEHKDYLTEDITIENNLVASCNGYGAIVIGGYEKNKTGSAENIKLIRNTICDSDENLILQQTLFKNGTNKNEYTNNLFGKAKNMQIEISEAASGLDPKKNIFTDNIFIGDSFASDDGVNKILSGNQKKGQEPEFKKSNISIEEILNNHMPADEAVTEFLKSYYAQTTYAAYGYSNEKAMEARRVAIQLLENSDNNVPVDPESSATPEIKQTAFPNNITPSPVPTEMQTPNIGATATPSTTPKIEQTNHPAVTCQPSTTTNPTTTTKPTKGKVVKPGKVKVTKCSISKKRALTIQWKRMKAISGYRIILKCGNKPIKKVFVSAKARKKIFKSLKRKKTYKVCIQAYRKNGKKKLYGKKTEITKKIK